jgi:photosystem II PsbZ protein
MKPKRNLFRPQFIIPCSGEVIKKLNMLSLFQLVLFALVFLSLALVIGVPVLLASPEGWASSKNIVFAGTAGWLFLVFFVGTLNSFVV